MTVSETITITKNIQLVSDLHIEFKNDNVPNPWDYIEPSSDILILAGDIGSFYKMIQLTEFLKIVCKRFKKVFYVPGNHEWYRIPNHTELNWTTLEERMKNMENEIDNLTILNRSCIIIGKLCIAGATLWSKPDCEIPPYIVRIRNMNKKEYEKKYEKDLEFVNNTIKYCENNDLNLMMVTHHAPTKKVLQFLKKDKKFPSLYASDLDHLLDKTKVQVWACGHVHTNFDFISDKGCRVVGNQKGKPKDKISDYKKKFIIDLSNLI